MESYGHDGDGGLMSANYGAVVPKRETPLPAAPAPTMVVNPGIGSHATIISSTPAQAASTTPASEFTDLESQISDKSDRKCACNRVCVSFAVMLLLLVILTPVAVFLAKKHHH